MGLFSWLNANKEVIEQTILFEYKQDAEGEENDYFMIVFETSVLGHKIKVECSLWGYDDRNIETGRVVCEVYLEAIDKLTERVIPVSFTFKDEKLSKILVNTDYLAEKTGVKLFEKLDYQIEAWIDGEYFFQ